MNFLALVGAIILRYRYPYAHTKCFAQKFLPYFNLLERNLNDGKYLHGVFAWLLAVLLPSLLIGVLYYWLSKFNSLLAVILCGLVLYLCLRFNQFEKQAEHIAIALQVGNIDLARLQLSDWQQIDTRRYTHTQIAKLSIENTFRLSHQYLFGPLFWFIVLGLIGLGPAPVLFYRLSLQVSELWEKYDDFGSFSRIAYAKIDWLPAHATASAFAMVGDFEDALFCWRSQAESWINLNLGIIYASGAGALGVKLGDGLPSQGIIEARPELGLGDDADAEYLKSAIGMVWRVLVLVVSSVMLLTFAYWLGN